MPLIVLCGYPSCGKSSAADELNAHFVSRSDSVRVITDRSLVKDTTLTYSNPQKEKEVRNRLKSEVQKILDKDTVVILDSLNYIKGYRYELYALSKACKTTQCTVYLDAEPDVAWKKNEGFSIVGDTITTYTRIIVIPRFEAPDAKNRWDRPLFVVGEQERLPFDDISKAILQPPPPPNQSTLTQPLSPTQFLYETDQVTQHIITMILKSQDDRDTGEPFLIPGTTSTMALTRRVTLAELSRLRRQFISYNNVHPVEDTSKLPHMFVQFLTNRI